VGEFADRAGGEDDPVFGNGDGMFLIHDLTLFFLVWNACRVGAKCAGAAGFGGRITRRAGRAAFEGLGRDARDFRLAPSLALEEVVCRPRVAANGNVPVYCRVS